METEEYYTNQEAGRLEFRPHSLGILIEWKPDLKTELLEAIKVPTRWGY